MEEAKIDSTTGGLIFKEVEKPHTLQDMHKSLSTPIPSMQSLMESHKDLNKHYDPKPSKLSLEERVKLAMQVGEEVTTPEELKELFSKKEHPVCYDGFEPSGRMHIAQGVFKMINVNRLTQSGCVFYFWVADWFAKLNNKMGGDLEKIRCVGHYFIEVWKALGMNLDNVKFLWCSEEIMKDPETYWGTVMDVAMRNSVTRIKRCATIMGRKEEDDLSVAQCLYPCMQCTDIFYLGTDICQLGMDQRKVNVLAREWAQQVKVTKPIILSHHMLLGLIEGQEKMSKSHPDSAIFMEDTEEDVNRKMKKAFCPPQKVYEIVDGKPKIINPCFDYLKHIVFGARDSIEIKRKPENGGNIVYKSYQDAEDDFLAGKLHPGDLKPALAKVINELVQPVRDHFKNDPFARQLLEVIRSFTITR